MLAKEGNANKSNQNKQTDKNNTSTDNSDTYLLNALRMEFIALWLFSGGDNALMRIGGARRIRAAATAFGDVLCSKISSSDGPARNAHAFVLAADCAGFRCVPCLLFSDMDWRGDLIC